MSVRSYSTFSFPSQLTERRTIPSDSSSFSCLDSILEVISPILFCSSENLRLPSKASMHMMVHFHLPSITDIAASSAQL